MSIKIESGVNVSSELISITPNGDLMLPGMVSCDYELSGDSMAERRKPFRKKNYTPEEEKLLLKIIEPYTAILENKRNSCNIRNAKNTAWSKIASLFNALTTLGARSEVELRKRWDNNKTKVRNQMKLKVARRSGSDNSSEFQKNDCDPMTSFNSVYRNHHDSSQSIFDSRVAVDDLPATDSNSEDNSNCIVPVNYEDADYNDSESPIDPNTAYQVLALEGGDEKFDSTPSCSSDQHDTYARARRRMPHSNSSDVHKYVQSSENVKAEYFKFKKQVQIRSLQLAEEQNERAKVLFDLDVRKKHLELELLQVQIESQKKLLLPA